MNRTNLSNYAKAIVIAVGLACVTNALLSVPTGSLSAGYLLILVFSIFIAPRLSISLPRSSIILSFSDSIVVLTFLIYGGQVAIVTAFIVTVANCVYLKKRVTESARWFILFNSSLSAIVAAFAYLSLRLITTLIEVPVNPSSTRTLVTILGILALSQFFSSSILAAVYQNIREGLNVWEVWKKQGLSSAHTQFTGAAVAGLVYKVINYSDVAMAAIAFLILAIAYANYRKMISDIGGAISQVEEAEKQKAEIERERRVEAEEHASQLKLSLEKEERANEALRKSEKDFQHAALHDSLTGLANRKNLNDILRKLISDYRDDPSGNFQVLFLDIKGFKKINDSLGHSIGDKVLMIAAKRFQRMINPGDTVARIGGDEFAIVLRNLSTVGKAQKVARKIYGSITQPFSLSGNQINIDVNIGIAPCDAEYNTPEEILRDADIAMHYAKERSAGPAVFTKELRARFLERIRFEMDLRSAIDRGELAVHYQPIVNLTDGRLVGFEALLRWHHGEFGMIPPNKFIPIAEQSGLIRPITVWVLKETCDQLVKWQKISAELKDLMISVNISGKHLSNDDLIEDVEEVLESSKVRAETLKLEITESTAMENAEHTINVLNRLKHIGVQLSIDDFGTGYSSLSILHRLPFDTLKIDRSFVYSVGERGENSEILQTIISLAKNLKMRVIAEGVETTSQLAVLQNLGCDYAQGFMLAKPKPRDETEELIYRRHNWLPEEVSGQFERVSIPGADDNLPVF